MNYPEHMILSGGGFDGIYIICALKQIEKIINDKILSIPLRSLTTVSVGSLIGIAILCGYTMDELVEFMIAKSPYFKTHLNFEIQNLVTKYGACNNDMIHEIVLIMIKRKYKNYKDMTFKQLYDITNIEFNISVTNITKNIQEVWSYKTHPHVSIALASQISCCIPFVFSPIMYNGCIYIDGAMICNCPLDKLGEYPDKTLCITLDPKCEVNTAHPENLEEYTLILISVFRNSLGFYMQNKFFSTPQNTLYINKCVKKSFTILDMNTFITQMYDVYSSTSIDLDELIFFKNIKNKKK